ncbi:response regulator transcription factor [Burkholderia multivorans]|uniref:response regulator transcription factor n=1 Tax=Burkholderia multivorans TaxID=87883 RepID=UPI0021BE7F5E|nr:response regulator [Burkholderia multivorans]
METILLVDDDARILELLRTVLEARGYRVLVASDGEAAVSVTSAEHPDLIVTDWMMPVLDGVALCRGGVRISVFKAGGTITRKVERTDLHKG